MLDVPEEQEVVSCRVVVLRVKIEICVLVDSVCALMDK